MAKLAESAIYGPHKSYLVCLRCMTRVSIESAGSSVRLVYDFDDWQQRECCRHVNDLISCCYFADLRQALTELPRPH